MSAYRVFGIIIELVILFVPFTGQIWLIAHYSWKNTGNPQAYLEHDTLTSVAGLLRGNPIAWAVYLLPTLGLTVISLPEAPVFLLGVPPYAGFLLGFVGFVAVEVLVYKTRHLVFRIALPRSSHYWKGMEAEWRFRLGTWPWFVLPLFLLAVRLWP